MKLIVGILLVATALAYPLGESEEKPQEPLVISDSYSSVSKAEEVKHELEKTVLNDSSSENSSSSSEEDGASSEQKPAEPIKAPEEPLAPISLDQPAIPQQDQPQKEKEEARSAPTELPAVPALLPTIQPETPLLKPEEKVEEPKIAEEKKPEEPLPTLKKVETEAVPTPQLKSLAAEAEIKEPATPAADPIKLEEKIPEKLAVEGEKPLALPIAPLAEESLAPAAAASEIKEQVVVLQNEQKVEAPAAAEEKLPELKSTIAEEKKEEPIEAIPEKKAKSEEPRAEEIASQAPLEEPASELPQAATELPALAADAPKPAAEDQQPIADQVATDAKPIEAEKPIERQPEGKSAEALAKPAVEAIQPIAAINDEPAAVAAEPEAAKPEKPVESALSSWIEHISI